jgi:putative ABC transport system ATP-binding protein
MTGVRRTFALGDQEVVALDEVDLTVDDEMVVLMGPSGSGKTTLLSVAGALLGASGGSVRVGDDDISRLDGGALARFRREQIGFVFQNVNLVPFLTARENLLVVRELGGGRRDRDARRRADQLLEELGLADRADNLPAQLSGGQRQRVAIGRALMNDPALVLVDEPTSALDSQLGRQVMELLREEVTGRGVSAIVVTHDDLVTEYGDRTIRMADGRLLDEVAGHPVG